SERRAEERKKRGGTDPSRLQLATNRASASYSLVMSHSLGRLGLGASAAWGGWFASSVMALTSRPSTRMTTSCARELIALAWRMRATSSGVLTSVAWCSAGRRYLSVDTVVVFGPRHASQLGWREGKRGEW